MNKAELIEKLSTTHGLTKAQTKKLLDDAIDTIITQVKKGDTVSILGFGSFKLHARAARKGFNPAKGTAIKIAAQKVPKFVPGAAFKASVDPKKAAARKAAVASRAVAKKAAPKKTAAKKVAKKG